MEIKPLISVLLPVYNCELYIKEAVDSILGQTYTNFELIIIDDCSTDATVSILKTYNDARINLIVKPQNSGYTNSLNYGISIAKGKYIARMDGDDISLPKRFEKQVFFLENNPDVVLCGTCYSVIGTDTFIMLPENNEEIKFTMLKYCPVGHPTVIMRKSTLEQLPFVYDISKEPAEDYDLWVRLINLGKLHNLQEILLMYRMHGNQVSVSRNSIQKSRANEAKLLAINYLDILILDSEKKSYLNIINCNESTKYIDILIFSDLKIKLIKANQNTFFNKIKFEIFLNDAEKKSIKKYFLRNNENNPIKFFRYLKLKSSMNEKLSLTYEIKLFIKSFVFFKK